MCEGPVTSGQIADQSPNSEDFPQHIECSSHDVSSSEQSTHHDLDETFPKMPATLDDLDVSVGNDEREISREISVGNDEHEISVGNDEREISVCNDEHEISVGNDESFSELPSHLEDLDVSLRHDEHEQPLPDDHEPSLQHDEQSLASHTKDISQLSFPSRLKKRGRPKGSNITVVGLARKRKKSSKGSFDLNLI